MKTKDKKGLNYQRKIELGRRRRPRIEEKKKIMLKAKQQHISLELKSIGKKINKKMKKEKNMKKGRSTRSRRRYCENRWYTCLILCYHVANPPKTKDKNNKGGVR